MKSTSLPTRAKRARPFGSLALVSTLMLLLAAAPAFAGPGGHGKRGYHKGHAHGNNVCEVDGYCDGGCGYELHASRKYQRGYSIGYSDGFKKGLRDARYRRGFYPETRRCFRGVHPDFAEGYQNGFSDAYRAGFRKAQYQKQRRWRCQTPRRGWRRW